MQEAGHLSGGAGIYTRYPVRVSIATAGIPVLSITDAVGLSPPTTTQAQDVVGLGLDVATYSTTQTDLAGGEATGTGFRSYGGLDMGRMVTVSVRPDLLVRARVSGSATAGVALTTLTNTVASSGGTLITAANVPSADMRSGTVWGLTGNNVGYARHITSHAASVSFTVTVPFPRAIAVGDTFLFTPYSGFGTFAASLDGSNAVQLTTLFDQADGSIASGTGAELMVVKQELEGTLNTNILTMFRDHQWNRHTVPS